MLEDTAKVQADRTSLTNNLLNLKKMHDGGVTIGFGTDSGATPLRIPGFAEHRELTLMVEAGVSPVESIRIATFGAAQLLGLQDRGSLEPNKLADFVVVDGDPSKDNRRPREHHRGLASWPEGVRPRGCLPPVTFSPR
ncbi:MAG: amidohydrolase family protein [Rhizomicrobium sp.]